VSRSGNFQRTTTIDRLEERTVRQCATVKRFKETAGFGSTSRSTSFAAALLATFGALAVALATAFLAHYRGLNNDASVASTQILKHRVEFGQVDNLVLVEVRHVEEVGPLRIAYTSRLVREVE